MAQAPNRTDPERRLRFLRLCLILMVAAVFAAGASVTYVMNATNLVNDVGAALVQGLLWGVGAAVVAVIAYLAYQKIALKK
jgi:hypothetical protein